MTERLLLLALAVGIVWLAVAAWERRRTVAGALTPGLTVLTAPGCSLCEPAVEALRGTGTAAPIRVVDVADAGIDGVRSVPTVVAVRGDGTVALQRSGMSAIRDAGALVAALA